MTTINKKAQDFSSKIKMQHTWQ